MRSLDFFRLLLLAAIWGASFLFMRLIAPVLGALWTTEFRVGIAGIVMLLVMWVTRRALNFSGNWKQYLVLGTLNSALPFALFSYAALILPAGYSAIVNATTPLWGALIGAMTLGERLTVRKIGGLLIGIAGVAFLVRLGPAKFTSDVVLAVLACAAASLCYGIAGAYSKKTSSHISPPLMATGSLLAAALVLVPFLPLAPMRGDITPFVFSIAVALALLCSAVAYLIYFRLIADVGPTKALTVTFLIPLFALLWGALFLHEQLTANMAVGCALVATATWLVVFPSKTVSIPTDRRA